MGLAEIVILHIDLDAFFANCERLADPSLAGKPLIIGHRGPRGVVSTCSYEARTFGVRSAMPSVAAERLCPQAIWIAPRISYYAPISAQIRNIFHRYTPHVEPVSIDEAYLDMAGTEGLFGPAATAGRCIQAAILAETGLTASVGVAPNKFLAKIASDMKKPNGFVVVAPEEIDAFLAPLPVRDIGGVGPATERTLAKFGIRTVGQLRAYPLDWLVRELGRSTGSFLYERAQGIDRRSVAVGDTKSVSNETTFMEDIREPHVLLAFLQQLSEEVSWRLRKDGLRGRTVTLKLRYADFRTLSRSLTLGHQTDITQEIFETACLLLARVEPGPVRLVGVGLSGFETMPEQPDLFNEPKRQKQQKIDAVLDRIQQKYGPTALRRGLRQKK